MINDAEYFCSFISLILFYLHLCIYLFILINTYKQRLKRKLKVIYHISINYNIILQIYLMGQYWLIVNLLKKQYLLPKNSTSSFKLM